MRTHATNESIGYMLREREKELAESRRQLAVAQRVGGVGSAEVALGTGETRWSGYFFALLGLDPASVTPSLEAFVAAVHPDDREAIRRLSSPNREGLDTEPIEFRIIRPDGEVRWLYRVAELLRDESGVAHSVIASIHDITDRKHTEIELRDSRALLLRSERHLALAQRVAGVGSVEIDLQSGETYWSEEVFRLLDVPPNTQPSSEIFIDKIHPDDKSIVRSLMQSIEYGVEAPPVEFRVLRPGGEVRWIRRHQAFVCHADNRPTAALVTLQDITVRKQFELELAQREVELYRSEAHLARAQKVGHVGSGEIDLSIGRIHWSEEMLSILGVDAATCPTNLDQYYSMVHPDDQGFIAVAKARMAQGVIDEPRQFRIVRPNGEVRWLYRTMEAMETIDGRATTLVSTLQDITDLKQAMEKLVELELQLAHAQKLEALGQLTGGVAHDFNNVLAVILGWLNMIDEEEQDRPKVREWVRTGINAVNRGAALIRSLLVFAGKQPLKPVEVDLRVIVEDTTDMLRRVLSETIEIKMSNAPDLWRCEVDPGQLQSALLNLALNARDAMPEGGTLIIETRNHHEDSQPGGDDRQNARGDYVSLAVRDTGMGMPPEAIGRVFEPFYSTKGPGKGSGLGLSMVYGFVRQSGGHIKIESAVGAGTTVQLFLPRSQNAGVAQGTDKDGPSRVVGGKESVLLVEDCVEMCELTGLQLERLGYAVFTAAQAAEALEVLDAHPEIELILTDLVLPGGISGWRLAEMATVAHPGLKVVYMSGYIEDPTFDEACDAPPLRLLQKPFESGQLAVQVRAALDKPCASERRLHNSAVDASSGVVRHHHA